MYLHLQYETLLYANGYGFGWNTGLLMLYWIKVTWFASIIVELTRNYYLFYSSS